MTSAPRSPRIWVAIGPMTTEVRSRTRTPARAPDGAGSAGTRGLDHPGSAGRTRAESDQRGPAALDLPDVALEEPSSQLERDGVIQAVLLAGGRQRGEHLGQTPAVVHVEGGHVPASSFGAMSLSVTIRLPQGDVLPGFGLEFGQ